MLLKYYKYLLQLKKAVYDRYGMVILKNIGCFIDNTDEQTKEYYLKVAESINGIPSDTLGTAFDNFYVDKIKPFYVNNEIYYEVTLEPATNRSNKFQRITAFTHHDIFSNYSVALSFVDRKINVFNTAYPIKVIIDWRVSIRPCEIDNFAELIGINSKTNRGYADYKALMDIITRTHYSLVDIIDLPTIQYARAKQEILGGRSVSSIVQMLDKCRDISRRNSPGKNIIRYLIYRMNNVIIRDQRPTKFYPNTYADYAMSSKCMPFDTQPYSFNPKGHITNIYDLFQCIDASEHKAELLKRYIDNNTYSNNALFTYVEELGSFGTPDEILALVEEYNNGLYSGFKPSAEIGVYKNHLFVKQYENDINKILDALDVLSAESAPISVSFGEDDISAL